jgi:hypothetical protein
MPGSKGTAGAPADPNSANPSGMGTGGSMGTGTSR